MATVSIRGLLKVPEKYRCSTEWQQDPGQDVSEGSQEGNKEIILQITKNLFEKHRASHERDLEHTVCRCHSLPSVIP